MKQLHDGITAGHPGREKTLELLTRNYYFPGMRKFVNKYVDHGDTCARIKPTRHAPYRLLKPLEIPKRPWQSISMDFVTGLPESNGHDAMWVVVDRLTKMAHYIPCNETTDTRQFAHMFITHVFKLHGLPLDITSDRGSLFTAEFWKELTRELSIDRRLSTAYHPQTDGQTERVNATMEQYLRAYCNYQQDNWAELLTTAEFCYNNTVSSTTKQTPFFANYGYHPNNDIAHSKQNTKPTPEVHEYITRLTELQETLRHEIRYAQETQSKQANKRRSPDPTLKPGDRVWLQNRNTKTTRPSKKLDYKRLGPFTINKRIGLRAYKLNLPPSMKIHPTFHISLLEPYNNNPIPGHIQPPPPPVIINEQEEYEIEQVLDSKKLYNKIYYRAKWKGYSHEHDQEWYPAENFENSPELTQDFHKRYPHKPKPQHVALS